MSWLFELIYFIPAAQLQTCFTLFIMVLRWKGQIHDLCQHYYRYLTTNDFIMRTCDQSYSFILFKLLFQHLILILQDIHGHLSWVINSFHLQSVRYLHIKCWWTGQKCLGEAERCLACGKKNSLFLLLGFHSLSFLFFLFTM